MNPIKKIFVPTDFSPSSQEAAAYAVFLAEQLNAALFLVHILEPVGYPVDMAILDAPEIERMNAGRKLSRLARLWKKKGIQVETALLKGDPASLIVEKAKKVGADLIVMGTQGRTGVAHLLFGSVAEMVVRSSPAPVLTVRRSKEKKKAEKPAAIPSKAKALGER